MSRVRRILEAEVASSTLVIHMDDRSTDFLKAIYEGKGYPVLKGHYSEAALFAAIKTHDRIFMLGHGGPHGLFNRKFMINDRFGALLAEKAEGLYIWCNADAYAKRNGLSGLVSGMFISEVSEASMFGIRATQQEVDASNAAFSRIVRQHLDTGQPLSNVRQCYTSAACKITQFNSARLYIFDHGVPTPVLHQSSLAHPPPPRDTAQGRFTWQEPEHSLDSGQDDLFYEPRAQEFRQEDWFHALQDIMLDQGTSLAHLSAREYEQVIDTFLSYFHAGFTPEAALADFNLEDLGRLK